MTLMLIWTLLDQEAFPSLLSLMHPSMEMLPALSITGEKIYILSSLSFISFHLNFLSLSLSPWLSFVAFLV
jgi:hypothetical protein